MQRDSNGLHDIELDDTSGRSFVLRNGLDFIPFAYSIELQYTSTLVST